MKKWKGAVILGDLCGPVRNRKTGVFASKMASAGSQKPEKKKVP